MQYIDCNINPISRVVSYPGATIVQRDTNVEALRFHFSLDAEYELENDSIRIMVLKDGKTNGFNAENVRVETNDGGDEELVFEHTITTHETATPGQIAISVCGNQVSGNNITEAWHTLNMVFQVSSAAHSESDEGEDTPETIASNAEKIAALQTLVNAITSGRPIPVDLKSKMTDTSAIYLYTGTETGEQHNYWYYHDGTSWVPGSEYGGMTIDDELSSTSENAVQNKVIKANFDEINGRLQWYPLAVNVTDGSYVVGSTGGIDTNANLSYAEVPVLAFRGKGITIQSYLWEGAGFAFLDVNGAYIYGESANTKGITPEAGVLTKVETSVPYNAYSLRVTLHRQTYAANTGRYFFTIGENRATKVVFIGDSYGTGYNAGGSTTGWIPGTAAALGLKSSDFESHAKGGAGFRHPANESPNETFTDLLNLSTLAKAEVGKIVVCGGYNEQLYTVSQLLEAFGTFAAKAREKYPFAEICIGMIGHSGAESVQETLMNTVRQGYMQMANRAGVRYLSNVEYVLTDDNVSSDGIHPDQAGADTLATAIGNAVKTGGASGKSYQSEIAEIDGRLGALNELLSAYEISPNFNSGFIKYDTLAYGAGGTHQYSDVVFIPAMSLVYVPKVSKSSSTSLLTLCDSEGNPVQCLIRGTTTAQSTGDFFIYPFVEDSYVRFGGNTAMSDYMRYYRKKFDEDYVVDVDSFGLLNPYNFDHSAGAIKEAGVATAAEYEYLANIALPKGMTIEFYGCAGAGVATLSEFSQTFTIQQILVAGTGFIQHEQYTAENHMLVRVCARIRPTETAFSVVLPEEKLFGWKIYYKPFHFNENKNSPLYQKKLTVIGDSLIHGNALGNGSTWVTNVGIKYNMGYVNLGDNGNPVATVNDSGEVAMVDRITDVPTDTDIFVLLGGANDKRFNVPLGEIDSTDKSTFYGALNNIISAVYARCPKAKILFMTTYCRYISKNSLGLGDEDYANAMIEAGRHNLVPVFDNYHNSGVNFLNSSQLAWIDESRNRQKKVNGQTTYIDPTHHFSIEGYEWITSMYEAALSAI